MCVYKNSSQKLTKWIEKVSKKLYLTNIYLLLLIFVKFCCHTQRDGGVYECFHSRSLIFETTFINDIFTLWFSLREIEIFQSSCVGASRPSYIIANDVLSVSRTQVRNSTGKMARFIFSFSEPKRGWRTMINNETWQRGRRRLQQPRPAGLLFLSLSLLSFSRSAFLLCPMRPVRDFSLIASLLAM